ncbi:MAG: hypothetical protein ACOZCO_12485 [Bacteroidota bacterium]
MRLAGTLILFLCWLASEAQIQPIGQWRDHLPYKSGIAITNTGNIIYTATENAIFYLDLEDNSMGKISKVNGLTTTGINDLSYDASTATVVIGYEDGNVDLLYPTDNSTYNLGDIKRSNIVADKSIYSVYCSAGFAYVCTGFGIVKIDLARKEVKDTYIIGPGGSYIRVNGITLNGNMLYAATDDGIYSGNSTNPFLSNYTSWTKETGLNTPVVNGPFSHIATFNNEVFVSWDNPVFDSDSVYYFNGTSWANFSATNSFDINAIDVDAGRIAFVHNYGVTVYDTAFTLLENIFDYVNGDPFPADVAMGTGNIFWLADKNEGMVLTVNTWNNQLFRFDGPRSAGSYRMDISGRQLWVAHGLVYGSAWNNYFYADMASGKNEKDEWITFVDDIDKNGFDVADSIFDLLAVAIDPEDNDHVFLGTMSFKGLLEINDGRMVAMYDENNSSLQEWSQWADYVGISELSFDKEGNLWVANSFVDEPLSVKKKSGGWQSFDLGPSVRGRNYRELVVGRESGLKWIAIPSSSQSGGLAVFDDKGTLSDLTDDQYFMYTTAAGAGGLPSADVLTVAEDLDGEIWIGTGAGIAVVYTPENVFGTGNFDAQQILIEQDGNIQILLETEVISAIAIDGANRKWIGTDGSGVYLMSEDGTEQLYHFTAENSPLLSNQVTDVRIDHETGEVFFATMKGIVSFRGTATIEENPYTDVYAFPNPVRPGYEGVIAIKGISRDSDVKITDIAGNIVFITKSEGGQAIWDGKNLKGEKVKTGIYTVMCNSESGKSKSVAKILFVN